MNEIIENNNNEYSNKLYDEAFAYLVQMVTKWLENYNKNKISLSNISNINTEFNKINRSTSSGKLVNLDNLNDSNDSDESNDSDDLMIQINNN